MKDQILGMLWGLHAGDALGATLEFKEPSPSWNTHTEVIGEGPFHWKPGAATDDTDLMMCVLRSLLSPQDFSFDHLKQEMLAWFAKEPKDIGTTTIKGLRHLKEGKPLRECGFRDEKFQGNGSLMRVAPMALLQIPHLDEVLKTQTLMTHGHELCVECDRIFIESVRLALDGANKKDILTKALQRSEKSSPFIFEYLKQIPTTEWSQLKTSGFCVETLGAAYWGLLRYEDFETALIAIVNRGDDSDSCGAVAGALCGAFYGADKIPQRWLAHLEFKNEILGHVERLLPTIGA